MSQHASVLSLAFVSSGLELIPALWFTRCASLLLPIQPTTSVLSYILVSMLLRQLCCGTASNARSAIKYYLFVCLRFGEAETIFELFFREEECIWLGLDR